jgi:coatomer protein complex subunit alpha (xenin)
LHRQIGAVNFVPLKSEFLAAWQSSHLRVAANPSLPPLQVNVRRNPESAEQREALPFVTHSLEALKEGVFADGLKLFTRGKFVESLESFRRVFQQAVLLVVKTDAEVLEVSCWIRFCEGLPLIFVIR